MLSRQIGLFILMISPAWLVEGLPLDTDLHGAAISGNPSTSSEAFNKMRSAKFSQEPAMSDTGLSTSLIRGYEMHNAERTDQITLFYHCPYAGHTQYTFRVRTQYSLAANEVTFHDELGNIAQFKDTWQSEGNPLNIEFDTWLNARQCIRHNPHVSCTYKYKAFIEGAVAPGILESAVIFGHNHDEVEPLITEKCRTGTRGAQGSCPVDTDRQDCTILDVVSTPFH